MFDTPGASRRAAGVATLAAVIGAVLALSPLVQGAARGAVVTQLADDVVAGLSALHGTPTAADTPMQVAVAMTPPNRAALDRAYAAIYTPGSPRYHHFLTAAQVAATFGEPDGTTAAVRQWAIRDGLRPLWTAPNGEYLLLAGTTGQVERTFGVSIDDFVAGGRSFSANTSGPTVPADVTAVLGLSDVLRSRTFDHAPPAAAAHGATAQDTCLPGACIGLTTPQDLWSIYGQPTSDGGQGQQLAVLGEGAVAGPLSDLRLFEKEFHLPQVPVTIHSVGDDFKDTAGSTEWDIDMQASTGMAPEAVGETLYFSKDLGDASVAGDVNAWSADPNGPMQADASFGECEQDPTSPPGYSPQPNGVLAGSAGVMFTTVFDRALEEATLQGKTLFAATGDTGSSCPVLNVDVNGVGNELLPETNYPASSPFAVAVGGTVLYGSASAHPARVQETAWTFTGGGNTFYVPGPTYQRGITLLDEQPCIAKPSGAPPASSAPCRGIPDVAAQSGDVISNGYAITTAGTPDSAGGGTSLSSPLWVGMWARVQAAAPPSPTGIYSLGFANETVYRVAKNPAQDAAAFFDIGSGPPASPPTINGYYASLPRTPVDPTGWDYLSGLGSPNVTGLGVAATGNRTMTPTRPLAQPAPRDCGQPGLAPCSSTVCTAAGPRWTNPDHVATDALGNDDPQLSLTAGSMAVSSGSLLVTLTVDNLSATVPTGATGASWYGLWDFKGTTYFASAEIGLGGAVDYGDGTYSAQGGFSQAHDDRGTMKVGPGGTITVKVPLANVGLASGATLTSTAGKTFIEEGVPASALGGASGLELAVDRGGPGCPFTV